MHAYLNLATTLAWREIVVRYKRSAFGVVWALADPMLHAVVYLVVFGQILDAGRGVAGYPLFMLLGVLAWIFFSTSVDNAAGVLLEHAPLIRKLAFPTELLVTAVVVSRLATFLTGIAIAVVLAFIMSLVGTI